MKQSWQQQLEADRILLIDGALIPMGPTVVNIMHSEIDAIPQAIELVRHRWSGPIGGYPESGYFTKPHWNFVDVLSPADLVAEARGWVAAGVRLLGGCCGTGPQHIEALRAAMPELHAARGGGRAPELADR